MDTYTQINISGGKIWGNTSTSGGIIAAVSNHINITGGTITGNTVKKGAVYGRNENNISVSGAPTIYGNNGGNLYLADSRLLTVGELTGGKIGIGAAPIDRIISNAITAEEFGYFVSDSDEVALNYKDDCLYLGNVDTHIHGADGKDGDLSWTKWTDATSLPTDAGNYYLENDVQMSGTVTISANVNLCLNGKTITAADGKRIFTVGKGATVTLTDCCDTCGVLTGGSYTYGSAISVSRGGVFNMYNGKITGNTASEEGAVYVQSGNDSAAGAIFNLYGGEISGNTGKKGGAITLSGKDAQVNIYDAIIKNNQATKDGGAIYVYDGGILRLAGGQITDNIAQLSAGGVYVSANAGKILVEGTPVVKNNKNGEQNNNIYLLGGSVLVDVGLKSGAELSITTQKTNRIISSLLLSDEAASCFYSDSAYREVVEQNGYIYCNVGGDHAHCNCATLTQGCNHLQTKWEGWESTNSLPTASGYYYLVNDVQLTGAQTVAAGEDVHLCLNGKTVTAAAGSRVYTINGNAKLSITDCENTGKLTGGNRTYGGAINVSRGAIFNLYGGILTGNTSQTVEGMGGAVYAQAASADVDGGVFNMYGGKITGNSANKGGAISTGDGVETTKALAQINIYGGQISDNQSAENGGAIRTGTYGLVNIYGGTISGNHCETRGGAIYIGKEGKLNIQGGQITKNTTVTNGAAIYTLSETTISGGEITNNVSGADGGALYASGTTLEISGGTFSGNKVTKGAGGAIGVSSLTQAMISGGTITENAAANGGAIIVQGGADLTIKGGTISKNEATIYAGAIYVNVPGKSTGDVSVLTIEGGTITQNKSVKNGGGLYITEAEFVMTGGEISKNESPTYGGGVFAIRSTSKLTGGTISGNVSTKDGAGAYFNAGTAEIGGNVKATGNNSQKGAGGGLGFTKECKAKLTGGSISNNIAGNAGGIIVQGKAHLVMTGGSVTNNESRQAGGGIYVNKSSMDFFGGSVSGNKSVKNGAGLHSNASTLRFAGTNFTANKAEGSGGGVFISKGKITFTGGTFANNISERYAGGIYLSDTESIVNNIKVTGNSGKLGSGGFHCYKGKVTMNNVEASGNHSDTSCGGVYSTQFCDLTMNDCLVEKNTAPRGAGVMVNARASMTLNNVVIRYNEASEGAGVYVNSNVSNATINDCEIVGNVSKKRESTTGNMILGVGGAIYMNTATKTSSGQSILHVNNTVIRDNEAEGIGGGVYVNIQMHMYMDGCTIENNKSGDMGGGIYQASGTLLSVKDTDIIGNTSAGTGSAIYAGSDFTLDGGKITGNKTTDGVAVYLAPARYDGHSYTNATIKLGGDLIICDNQGTMEGDLYFDEGVAAAGTVGGFGQNTKIKVQLHSGILTNSLLAAYHYEGGDLVYTVTYGDRSLTDPEPIPSNGVNGGTVEFQSVLLYAGVGVFAVAVIAVAAVLILKKKKSPAGEAK